MKALCVSDKVLDFLYSPSVTELSRGAEVIFGCGDLPYYYLEYILSVLDVTLYYVHGNHDPLEEYTAGGERITGPGGGINLDSNIMRHRGKLVGGLEGSIRYKEGPFQYSESEMWAKVVALAPRLVYNRVFHGRALDILITHSPPFGIHNGRDRTHRGFKSFLWLMQRFKPRYLLHGHHHVYNPNEQTVTQYGATTVINVYPYKLLTLA
ncbi:MAG: metallophosphoesterase [Anaerolineae bacterium]